MESRQRVKPISPAAGYQGGKRNLARRICAIIDRDEHDAYCEPFVGMGGIFLRRSTRPKIEVINDIAGDVVTFFRVLQEHYPYFIDMLRFRLASRNEFERLAGMDPDRLTDLQRAARFLYLQRLAFGGKIAGRNFAMTYDRPSQFNVARLEPMLADLHDRLAPVTIEQLPFERFIPKYDRPGTLQYLDPPYFGCEDDYGAGLFGPDDFARMAEILSGLQGRFLLSINDTPEIRACFAGFRMIDVKTTYTISAATNAKRAGELLISNFDIDPPDT